MLPVFVVSASRERWIRRRSGIIIPTQDYPPPRPPPSAPSEDQNISCRFVSYELPWRKCTITAISMSALTRHLSAFYGYSMKPSREAHGIRSRVSNGSPVEVPWRSHGTAMEASRPIGFHERPMERPMGDKGESWGRSMAGPW